MTPEQRMLLEGDEKRSARNLPKMGFGDATGAPPRFAARIAEIRSAILERRPIPQPSAEYRATAQVIEQRLFPNTKHVNQRVEEPTKNNVEKLRRLLDAASIF
jgi:hypothetical protein